MGKETPTCPSAVNIPPGSTASPWNYGCAGNHQSGKTLHTPSALHEQRDPARSFTVPPTAGGETSGSRPPKF